MISLTLQLHKSVLKRKKSGSGRERFGARSERWEVKIVAT